MHLPACTMCLSNFHWQLVQSMYCTGTCATNCLQAAIARSGSPRPASAARTPAQWRIRAPACRGDTLAMVASSASAGCRISCTCPAHMS